MITLNELQFMFGLKLIERNHLGETVPHSSSAKKRMRQALRRRERNRAARTALRTAIKKVRTASADEGETAYRSAVRLLDRAARKGLIHKNAAARGKRRLGKVVASKS